MIQAGGREFRCEARDVGDIEQAACEISLPYCGAGLSGFGQAIKKAPEGAFLQIGFASVFNKSLFPFIFNRRQQYHDQHQQTRRQQPC